MKLSIGINIKKAFAFTSVIVILQVEVSKATGIIEGVFLADSLAPTSNHSNKSKKNLEIPLLRKEDRPLFHTGFSLLFDEQHKQARWVAYSLTKNLKLSLAERTDKFVEDPLLKLPAASNQDYLGSGFDKGHLAPALDMSWSQKSMYESFYLTNISPQFPGFNRGIWKKLETLVRSWSEEYDTIYIVTGPILNSSSRSIGFNSVTVPEHFYKVIVSISSNKIKGIGFIMPNKSSNAEVKDFSVSIDSVETLTKIDFFPTLPDAVENNIEKDLCISCWAWRVPSKPSKKDSEETLTNSSRSGINSNSKNMVEANINTTATLKQCLASTKSGLRCKRMTMAKSGRCFQHE